MQCGHLILNTIYKITLNKFRSTVKSISKKFITMAIQLSTNTCTSTLKPCSKKENIEIPLSIKVIREQNIFMAEQYSPPRICLIGIYKSRITKPFVLSYICLFTQKIQISRLLGHDICSFTSWSSEFINMSQRVIRMLY